VRAGSNGWEECVSVGWGLHSRHRLAIASYDSGVQRCKQPGWINGSYGCACVSSMLLQALAYL
jgi:hypothetical protein